MRVTLSDSGSPCENAFYAFSEVERFAKELQECE